MSSKYIIDYGDRVCFINYKQHYTNYVIIVIKFQGKNKFCLVDYLNPMKKCYCA